MVKKTDDILGEVGLIRANNNWLWMRILALAFEKAPKQTRALMKEIQENDKEISQWLGRL